MFIVSYGLTIPEFKAKHLQRLCQFKHNANILITQWKYLTHLGKMAKQI